MALIYWVLTVSQTRCWHSNTLPHPSLTKFLNAFFFFFTQLQMDDLRSDSGTSQSSPDYWVGKNPGLIEQAPHNSSFPTLLTWVSVAAVTQYSPWSELRWGQANKWEFNGWFNFVPKSSPKGHHYPAWKTFHNVSEAGKNLSLGHKGFF
jgi:hypothetical protein